MSLMLESEKKIKVDNLKTPLFSLDDNRVVFVGIKGEECFALNEITDVRFIKERNLSANIIFLFFTVLLYFIISDYYYSNFIYYAVSYVFTIAASVFSLSVEYYTYGLYIQTRNLGFKKLNLSKKDESNAMHFVSLIKCDYFKHLQLIA